jgi:Fe-S-cluster-containing hydrogenase component 2
MKQKGEEDRQKPGSHPRGAKGLKKLTRGDTIRQSTVKTSPEKTQRHNILAMRTADIWRIAVSEGETAFTGDPQRPSEKCTGCMSCMAICALSKEGVVSSECSGIRIHHQTSEWTLKRAETLYVYSLCRQCPGVPPCDEVCPVRAHYRDEDTGAVVVDHEQCIRCGQCVKACPYDACWLSEEHDKVYKCDLCHGNNDGPQCIKVCPSLILNVKAVV